MSTQIKDSNIQPIANERPSVQEFDRQIDEKGWFHVKAALPMELVNRMKKEMNDIYPEFRKIHQKAGVADETEYAMHHVVLACPSMIDMLELNPIDDYLQSYFEGKYTINTLGGSIIKPNADIYTLRVHRDSRFFAQNRNLLVNTLVLLDDSTLENGATWMLSGSHKIDEKPTDGYFYENAERVVAKAGDILIFDGNIWHAAGENRSYSDRNILTPIYAKPYIKQQLDYPRAFGYDFCLDKSDVLRQVLGYNALVPSSLSEFYKKSEDRFYKSDQV